MPRLTPRFEPHPEDSEVLDSILDYPVEPGNRADDGNDAGEPTVRPPLLRRLKHALSPSEAKRGE